MRGLEAAVPYTAGMPINLLCIDADDTLWHHMRYHDAAERACLAMMASFSDEPQMRARLEKITSVNLRFYGYGAKSFTLTMLEAAIEICGDALTRDTVAGILAAGREYHSHPVELLDGVAETLRDLANRVRLVLVTKGDLLHQEAKLAASGLGDLFEGVEIVSDKTADTFGKLFSRYGVDPDRSAMAGDSMRSDILPVIAAGGWAAFIPPEIAWFHERAEVPTHHPRFAQLARFGELPAWLDTID